MKRLNARCDRGTSMIEFAIVAPVFIFLMIGIIEIGRYTYFAILAAHAARAGVQYGAQNLTTAADAASSGPNTTAAALQDAQSLANWKVTSSILCTANNVSVVCPTNSTGAVSPNNFYYVQVQVTGKFNSLLKYPGIPQQIPVTGSAVMRVGNQ
jgi:Flp pilus assembly protein TadG